METAERMAWAVFVVTLAFLLGAVVALVFMGVVD